MPIEQYSVLIWELPSEHGQRADERWQADCGNDHARGQDPAQAVDRLIAFKRAKAKADAKEKF